MKNDKFGRQILTEDDLCGLYYTNPEITIKDAFVESPIVFDNDLDLNNIPKFRLYEVLDSTIDKYDQLCQSTWYMPNEYAEMDIAKYILDRCVTEEELQRVGQELLLYQERDMFPLLRYLKYLVDTMRKHNIVWGVGRGSSVSSYVLFLLEVHRINSIHYDLSIDEFLK